MKKVINGKVYDTGKAKMFGNSSGGDGITKYIEELYQKRTGEYFLYGRGGPATKYAVSTGLNNWKGGAKIIPLDVEAARQWAEAHMDAEDYEALFGAPEEDGTERTAISALLPAGLLRRARQRAVDEKITLTAVLEAALAQYLE